MRLSEHFRPKELSDLVQPRAIIAPLQGMVRERKLMHLLLYGRAGVGKTSAARILIQSLDADAYEINGSLETGIETFRRDFDRWASSCSLIGGPKVCFIDECEKLSANAQAALRGVIEAFGNISFLMTANDISKLDAALKSRCIPLCFDIPSKDYPEVITTLRGRYEQRLRELHSPIDPARLHEIICLSFPDLRAIANRLQLEIMSTNAA